MDATTTDELPMHVPDLRRWTLRRLCRDDAPQPGGPRGNVPLPTAAFTSSI